MIGKKRKLSPAGARLKGANFERELVKRFKIVFPDYNVRRGFQSRSGTEAPDVETPVFWVEAKRGKKPSVRNALAQATSDAPKGRIPLVVVKDDRKRAHVTLDLDDFLEIIGPWWANQNK
jgi:hypothetical protein